MSLHYALPLNIFNVNPLALELALALALARTLLLKTPTPGINQAKQSTTQPT